MKVLIIFWTDQNKQILSVSVADAKKITNLYENRTFFANEIKNKLIRLRKLRKNIICNESSQNILWEKISFKIVFIKKRFDIFFVFF